MTDPSLIRLFVRPLNHLRIPYFVTGGVASVIYGEPRLTKDIDLVIQLAPRDVRRFARAWPPDAFYLPPVEVIEEESCRPASGHFNLSHHESAMRADVYLSGEDPLNAWALEHPVTREVEGEEVRVGPIEAVILSKLKYYRLGRSDRHLRDIAQMLRISGDLMDRPLMERWVARLELQREWWQAQEHRELP